MNQKLRHILLLNKKIHKTIAIVAGILCWYILGQSHVITRWVKIPVYFFDIPATTEITAPETISIKVSGKRSILSHVSIDATALHINAACIDRERYQINPFSHQLFLPEPVKMIDYIPEYCMISSKKIEAS